MNGSRFQSITADEVAIQRGQSCFRVKTDDVVNSKWLIDLLAPQLHFGGKRESRHNNLFFSNKIIIQ